VTKELEIKSKFDALYIDPIALKKIQYWTDAADGEVSGLGIVQIEEDRMVIREAFILDQECSGADTELDPEAISKLMTDIIKADKDPGMLKFWWHSHVNMGVFWSGTDDECAETLSTEYAFSLVVNKKKERRVRLDLYNPFRITVDHVRLVELAEEDAELKEQCEKDVKEKVKSKSWCYNKNKSRDISHYGKGYFGGDYDRHQCRDYYFEQSDNNASRPNGWGKRVKIDDVDLDDIKRLQELVHQWGYSEAALVEYIEESMMISMKNIFNKKANCVGGVGEFVENNNICTECDIMSSCRILTAKFGDTIYGQENVIKDIELTENDKEPIEVVVDSNERGGDNNG